MYEFLTHTWNTVKGKCPHDCSYCYMKRFPQKDVRFAESELKTNLGAGNTIFVGSSCDMFAKKIPLEWIDETIRHCKNYPKNTYLFQTRNTYCFNYVDFPPEVVLSTTIESNRDYFPISGGPKVVERAINLRAMSLKGYKTMITIEPVMDFDIDEMVKLIKYCRPNWINLGADSGRNNLPEPSKEKLLELISRLDIRMKKNFNRLLK